jgi:hypothetical protein
MFSRKVTRFVAAGAAAIAVAVGGVAIANSGSSSSSSGTANAAQTANPGQAATPDQATVPGYGPRAGQGHGSGQPRSGQAPGPSTAKPTGQIPSGWQPGTGTIITGAAADKAKAAAIAAKYQGTVNRVLQLSDGSYVVHIIGTSGPHHVFVSKDFKVMGSE